MTERLIKLQGYKLPCEQVWVDSNEMYEVYGKIKVSIDNAPVTELIITEILEEGLVVEILQ